MTARVVPGPSGKSVVVSGWGAGPEVVGDAGILVDPRSSEQAVAAIEKLLTGPDLSQQAKLASNRFSWKNTARKTVAVYEKLLGK